jgi:hypothetical protein
VEFGHVHIPSPGQTLRPLYIHLSVVSLLPEEDWFSEELQTLSEFFQAIINAADLISRIKKYQKKRAV